MKKKLLKICIVGAGWYGCHLGYKLIKFGYDVLIFEKQKDIFLGSSGFNQFRLHTGYHYPRSAHTVNEIQQNFKKFLKEYKNFIFFPKKNFYCIAKEKSLIDFRTYQNILKSHNLNSKKIKINFLQNIEGAVNSNEGVFLNDKIIQFYKKKLKKKIKFSTHIRNFENLKKEYDLVIDCTNNTVVNNIKKNNSYICTISLVYKLRKLNYFNPITIMDGELPSLYPYSSIKKTFTLTHSKYTHIKKFNSFKKLEKFKKKITSKQINNIKVKMEKDFLNYYKNFKKDFIYNGYFLSYKIIPKDASAKRPIFIKKDQNLVSLFSPKISNIFTAEEHIFDILNKNFK